MKLLHSLSFLMICITAKCSDLRFKREDELAETASVSSGSCGKSAVAQENGAEGIQPANLGAWPWVAAFGYYIEGGVKVVPFWHCGGSLINIRYVLTAANCIKGTPPKFQLTVVRLGEHDLRINTEGATPVDYGVEETIVHEEYESQANDIALVRLDRDVTFTDKIKPICLPTIPTFQDNNFEGELAFIAGWGIINQFGYSTNILQQVQVPVVDNESCREAYAKHDITIADEQLCAGEQKGGKDSCMGESGGALVLAESEIYYQIGVISFGDQKLCTEPGYPGVFTRVTSYLDWIEQNVGNSTE